MRLEAIPDSVVYFDQWATIDRPDVRRCFRPATLEEIAAVKRGDSVWLDDEPNMFNGGKVYGFRRVVITRLENGRFYHAAGFTTPSEDNPVFVLDVPSQLAKLLSLARGDCKIGI